MIELFKLFINRIESAVAYLRFSQGVALLNGMVQSNISTNNITETKDEKYSKIWIFTNDPLIIL